MRSRSSCSNPRRRSTRLSSGGRGTRARAAARRRRRAVRPRARMRSGRASRRRSPRPRCGSASGRRDRCDRRGPSARARSHPCTTRSKFKKRSTPVSNVIVPMKPSNSRAGAGRIFEVGLHDGAGRGERAERIVVDRRDVAERASDEPEEHALRRDDVTDDVARRPVRARRRRRPPVGRHRRDLGRERVGQACVTLRNLGHLDLPPACTPSSASSNTRRQPSPRSAATRVGARRRRAPRRRRRRRALRARSPARARRSRARGARRSRWRSRARRRRCRARRRCRSARARGSRPTARSCGRSTCRRARSLSSSITSRASSHRCATAYASASRQPTPSLGPSSVGDRVRAFEGLRSRRRRRRAAGARARPRPRCRPRRGRSGRRARPPRAPARPRSRCPRCSCTDASTSVRELSHALVGHRARDLVVARERGRVLVVVAELGVGAHHRRGRHHLAPAVADVLEQLDRVVAALDAFARAAAPQRDVARAARPSSRPPNGCRSRGLRSRCARRSRRPLRAGPGCSGRTRAGRTPS